MIDKILGMDKGTRERTIASLIIAITDVLSVFGIIDFSNEQINAVKNLVLIIASLIVGGVGYYYNNQFTEEACEGTGLTRSLKDMKAEDYDVWTEPVEMEEDEEDDDEE